ncbi:NAD(P)/FAD-dependent oxidoreductase [Zhihengliuella halotolerans]|uniref:Thioredoxin reductase n=1 Tax=Zhihengliuella halotolerans TaxID=370736 RepID=A0A4Q8AE99_9MICC|nr:NAD(P)/FAD-dependent oxidoreductase [Zhihengliuella halotolerans]RZU62592.1 thioredoxin reductase [Zhihengliuella halotolerans]
MKNAEYDVAIVGGSVAGLAAATALGRSLRRVVVLDAGQPRNAPSPAAHNVFANDGASPAELLDRARRDAEKYGVELRSADVRTLENCTDAPGEFFGVHLGSGERLTARRVLLATGLVDGLPAIDGLAEHCGTSVLHCPYCHGWEVRGQRIGVIGSSVMATHQALLFSQLSRHVTLITHDAEVTAEQRGQLAAAGVEVVDARIERAVSTGGRLTGVVLEDGTGMPFDALAVQSRMIARSELYTGLGGEVSENPMGEFIETDPRGATAIAGVWAAGNSADVGASVPHAAAAGVTAGAQLNMDLINADVAAKLAVNA